MNAYFGTQISPNQIETREGFLICKNVPIARVGNMEYMGREIGEEAIPDKVYSINRYPEEVFAESAIASFEGKPITDGHPAEFLIPETAGAYTKGHVQNVREDGELLVADLHIFDANLISEIQNKTKIEISCGYLCDYIADGDTWKQTNIIGNHVAVVREGRAGHHVSIKDTKGVNSMAKFTQEILKLLGTSAQGAKPEELDKLTATAAAVLDAMPDEEVVKVEEKVEEKKEEKKDDFESKLDKIIELLEKLDSTSEKDLMDEKDLDKEIVTIEAAGEKSPEEEIVAPAEDLDACKAADSALLRAVRPAVAGITDRKERAAVVDALLKGIRGDGYKEVFKATQDSARAKQGKKSYATLCEESRKAYSARNPHKADK